MIIRARLTAGGMAVLGVSAGLAAALQPDTTVELLWSIVPAALAGMSVIVGLSTAASP